MNPAENEEPDKLLVNVEPIEDLKEAKSGLQELLEDAVNKRIERGHPSASI